MSPTIPDSLSDSSLAVRTDNLTKAYGGRNVLDNLGLTVPEGATYALVGANGAGKTTTFGVLLDLVRADAGSATAFGRDARSEGPDVRAQIGCLSERPVFGYGWMTVEQLLRHHAAYYRAWDEVYAQKLARELTVPVRTRFGNLSKGETRRVQLVMCLAHRPPLLLLDEMTDGLEGPGFDLARISMGGAWMFMAIALMLLLGSGFILSLGLVRIYFPARTVVLDHVSHGTGDRLSWKLDHRPLEQTPVGLGRGHPFRWFDRRSDVHPCRGPASRIRADRHRGRALESGPAGFPVLRCGSGLRLVARRSGMAHPGVVRRRFRSRTSVQHGPLGLPQDLDRT